MKNLKKKGFTLVELLVVIAIIAVLATVSVVGYTAFIKKANQSADQQAVTQMNTVLEAAQAGESLVVAGDDASTASAIFRVLRDNGYSNEFVAYYEKWDFAYVIDNNKAYIVLVEDGKVAYPEKYEGKTDFKSFYIAVNNSEDLADALNSTGYVLLKTDSTFSASLDLTNNAVIIGDNKTLTDNVTVNTDTSSNTIVSLKELDKEVTVRMEGVNLVNPDGAYGRAIHVGKNAEKVTIIMDNVNISANHYGFNIAGNNKEVEVIMKNCTLEGYAALQAWSKCNVTLENCTIIGDDISTNPEEIFGAITLYGRKWTEDDTNVLAEYKDGAKGSVLTFKNCTFKMSATANNYYFFNSSADATINLEGCTFMVGETVVAFDQATHFYKGDDAITVTFNVK